MATIRSLSDVPEEGPFTPASPADPTSPYLNPVGSAASSSSTTLNGGHGGSPRVSGTNTQAPQVHVQAPPRTPSSSSKKSPPSTSPRHLGRSSSETLAGPTSLRKQGSSSLAPPVPGSTKDSPRSTGRSSSSSKDVPKYRSTPRLPNDNDVELAPSTALYWSKAPVYGMLPPRNLRGHTVTLVDTTAWVYGGCDGGKDVNRDIYCFDVETMQWTQPETVGDIPPPSRAHTATLIGDRKILVYGGGQGSTYYDTVYIFDTLTRRWSRPTIQGETPPPRRAHTAVLYKGKVWVFGGGNGMQPLNDVWMLDLGGPNKGPMRWAKVKTTGLGPSPRGYHTANVIGDVMVIIGGSDGKDCFSEIFTFNLEYFNWIKLDLSPSESYKRLAHSSTQVGSYLFIQGGHDGRDYISDMRFFNLVHLEYEDKPIFGKPPSARGYHVCVLADSRLFYIGGYNGTMAFDDVYIVDLGASSYLPQVTSFKIEV